MKYLKKPAREFLSSFSFSYEKPSICPHCGIGTDASLVNKTHFSANGMMLLIATAKCTACGKEFFFTCLHNNDPVAKTVCLYPDKPFTPYVNDTLSKISERFIEMYNQALFSEHGGNLDLAAIGYRASLEILVKDYAINELKEPPQDVEKKSLFSAIGDYLHQSELISTADVIRILGNDHTHYKRKYPQHDFSLLKFYMEIFLKQIEAAYMINHPPVSRP